MKKKWLEIANVKKLIDFSRRIVYHNFDDENEHLTDKDFLKKVDSIKVDDAEMDSLLPYNECKNIIKPFLVRVVTKNEIYFKIEEDHYDVFLNQLSRRMISNIVKDLVSKGMVESAFDNEKNDFVFWIKKHDEHSEE